MSQIPTEPDRGSTTSTPRWVKAFGIIGLALILLFVIAMLLSGGNHGPGRHIPSGNPGGHILPIEHGVQWL
jgi:hypothetical protein